MNQNYQNLDYKYMQSSMTHSTKADQQGQGYIEPVKDVVIENHIRNPAQAQMKSKLR